MFVIQKHQASHLHYDFRLEVDGVLKSWAVPKGPSYDPSTKRLAMMTEDHPYDYGSFEGEIPEGNYGAGHVIIWDTGTWELIEGKDPAKELRAGKLAFRLNGRKMFGEWALVKIAGREKSSRGNEWLLIKHRDEFANTEVDVTEVAPNSVVSNLSLPAKAATRSRKRRPSPSRAASARSRSSPSAAKTKARPTARRRPR